MILDDLHRAHCERLARMNAAARAFRLRKAQQIAQREMAIERARICKESGAQFDRMYRDAWNEHRHWLIDESRGMLGCVTSKSAAIMKAVCERYKVSREEMVSQRKSRIVVTPRMIFCYLAAVHTRMGHSAIGKIIDRHNTTVLHAIRTIQAMCAANPAFDAELAALGARVTEIGEGECAPSTTKSTAIAATG